MIPQLAIALGALCLLIAAMLSPYAVKGLSLLCQRGAAVAGLVLVLSGVLVLS